jgi:hypothetical protein
MPIELPLERWGATDDEVAASMPGDDLIGEPGMSATRSISLAKPPDEVFSWLAQMGTGRAGWYSYDLIDNFGRRSARELRPDWMVSEAGDTVPGGPISFDVAELDRPHHLVLALLGRRLAGHTIDFTLAFTLAELTAPGGGADAGTRLVSRARASIRGPLGPVANPALCIGDGLMVRRQLLGLADRCGRVSS